MSDATAPIQDSAQLTTAVSGQRAATQTAANAHRVRIPVRVPRGPRLNTFDSLSNRNFLFLWIGMLFLMAGAQMQMLAQSYLVYDLTGSASVLGIINLGIAVPMLTIPLFGGVVADRFEKKTIIQVAQLVAGSLALLTGPGNRFRSHSLAASSHLIYGNGWAVGVYDACKTGHHPPDCWT